MDAMKTRLNSVRKKQATIRDKRDIPGALKQYERLGKPDEMRQWIIEQAKSLKLTEHLPPELLSQDEPAGSDAPSAAEVKVGQKNPELGLRRKGKKKRLAIRQDAGVLFQYDAPKRVVHAVLQPPNEDTMPGSHAKDGLVLVYPPEAIQQACWDFMIEARNGAVGILHQEIDQSNNTVIVPNGENAIVVENFIAPCDYATPDGRIVTQGSWVQAYYIVNDDLHEAIMQGLINAPSLTSIDYELEDID